MGGWRAPWGGLLTAYLTHSLNICLFGWSVKELKPSQALLPHPRLYLLTRPQQPTFLLDRWPKEHEMETDRQ